MTSVKEFILTKRAGREHSPQELKAFIDGYLAGEIADYQVAAWLMAVYFRSMSSAETREWTRLMWQSGRTLPRSDRRDYWIDKHSTGGVGDKTSLILVPWVASACRRLFGESSVRLPMVSGRGLGHTGGTLDKLEAVPGFSPRVSLERALELLSTQGYFMMGQTDDMAPADRLLYSLRDVTGTVESLPLIVSSILSKKLSENLDGLVLDVKSGSGAFMKTPAEAEALARGLLDGAKGQGLGAVALLTSMEEPLGLKVGHQLEVEECMDFLAGQAQDAGLWLVTLELAAWMVRLSSRGKLSLGSAKDALQTELTSGRPLAEYRCMFEAQGGRWNEFVANREYLPETYVRVGCRAKTSGWVRQIDPLATGIFVTALGGGRLRKEDSVDFRVGVEFARKCGDEVTLGDIVAWVVCPRSREAAVAIWFEQAVVVGPERPEARRWLLGVIE